MAWSDAARQAAIAARRYRRGGLRNDLSALKPGTRELLAAHRTRQKGYWVGPNARFSRAGMAKDLRRSRAWKAEARAKMRAKADADFQRHLSRTRGFD